MLSAAGLCRILIIRRTPRCEPRIKQQQHRIPIIWHFGTDLNFRHINKLCSVGVHIHAQDFLQDFPFWGGVEGLLGGGGVA